MTNPAAKVSVDTILGIFNLPDVDSVYASTMQQTKNNVKQEMLKNRLTAWSTTSLRSGDSSFSICWCGFSRLNLLKKEELVGVGGVGGGEVLREFESFGFGVGWAALIVSLNLETLGWGAIIMDCVCVREGCLSLLFINIQGFVSAKKKIKK